MPPSTPSPLSLAEQLLQSLPPTLHAFAYGSAIIPQSNVNPSRRMVDLILVIQHPRQWHSRNLQLNPSHYSPFMRALGPSAIASLQQSPLAAQIYYNTVLPPHTIHPFKYGCITPAHLVHDLREWNSLYVAGRMQKPVRHLSVPPSCIVDAASSNHRAALSTALLALPPRFSEADLYTTIASLSYRGDIRMALSAEVCSKVADIVDANMHAFRHLYKPLAHDLGIVSSSECHTAKWSRDTAVDAQMRLLRDVPHSIRDVARRRLYVQGGVQEMARCDSGAVGRAVVETAARVVARTSARQAVKGFVSAGLVNSARYVVGKVAKSWRARALNRKVLQQREPQVRQSGAG